MERHSGLNPLKLFKFIAILHVEFIQQWLQSANEPQINLSQESKATNKRASKNVRDGPLQVFNLSVNYNAGSADE